MSRARTIRLGLLVLAACSTPPIDPAPTSVEPMPNQSRSAPITPRARTRPAVEPSAANEAEQDPHPAPTESRPTSRADSRPATTQPATTSSAPTTRAKPRVAPATWPEPSTVERTPSGLRLVAGLDQTVSASAVALVRLLLPFGSQDARAALVEVAMHSLVEMPDVASGTPALRQSIERSGGRLNIEIGRHSTAVEFAVPLSQWQQHVNHLGRAMRMDTRGSDHLERIRAELVNRWTSTFVDSDVATLARHIDRMHGLDGAAFIAELQDIDVEQVSRLCKDRFVATGAVLGLWVPGIEPEQAMRTAKEALEPWLTGVKPSDRPVIVPPEQGGWTWSVNDLSTGDFSLRLRLPSLHETGAIETLVAIELLTTGGHAGQLVEELGRAGASSIGAGAQIIGNGAERSLQLLGRAATGSMQNIWLATQAACVHLLNRQVTDAELQRAAQRTHLMLVAEASAPAGWLRLATSHSMHSDTPFDLEPSFALLDDPTRLDLQPAIRALSRRAPSLVVSGGKPPAAYTDLRLIADLHGPAPAWAKSSEAEQISSATQHLDLAIRAVGGKNSLAALRGYALIGQRAEPDNGPTMDESLWYSGDGRLRRLRRLLATTIETLVNHDKGVETASGDRIDLTREECRSLIHTAGRHPLILMAATARGELRWRLMALRKIDDREHAVLELVGEPNDRLRLFVDTDSGLVRVVEVRENRVGLGRVHVVERYADYRPIGDLRVPFRVATTIDDTTVIMHEIARFVPGVPDPECFALGADHGPLRGSAR